MKKVLYLIVVVVMVFAIVPSVGAATEVPPPPAAWHGTPDPYDCNKFGDCHFVIQVCIAGVTYTVGIYFDPALQTPEYIAHDALQWTDQTVLTYGSCPVAEPSFIEDEEWGEFWIIQDANGKPPCWYWIDGRYAEKRTQVPSLENIARICTEGFEQGSQTLYLFGTLYEKPMFFNTATGAYVEMDNRPPGYYHGK